MKVGRGLGVRIFLTYWFIQAVVLAVFALLPERAVGVVFHDQARRTSAVAAGLLASSGTSGCAAYAGALREHNGVELVLFDAAGTVACAPAGLDAAAFRPALAGGPGDAGLVRVALPPSAGRSLVGVARAGPGFSRGIRPPFPTMTVALTVLVSGIVCLVVARRLTRPLQLVRDTSYRLAAGDLQARAGPSVGARGDEIGDLVRDFDVMAARLEALVHAQSQILSDISHELRSPLARLHVALELARRKAGPDAAAHLQRIEAEADRMNDLIGRVLALARAERGALHAKAERVDVAVVVREVTGDAAYEAERQQKRVTLAVGTAPVIVGDAQLVASAVDNVVRNAVRHAPERSAIEVRVDTVGPDAIVTVRDRGPGVPAAELDRIFLPFHRTEFGRNRETGGVGLGLSIARRAVAVHEGTISAENAEGGGLVVTIRLPLARALGRADARAADTSLHDPHQS